MRRNQRGRVLPTWHFSELTGGASLCVVAALHKGLTALPRAQLRRFQCSQAHLPLWSDLFCVFFVVLPARFPELALCLPTSSYCELDRLLSFSLPFPGRRRDPFPIQRPSTLTLIRRVTVSTLPLFCFAEREPSLKVSEQPVTVSLSSVLALVCSVLSVLLFLLRRSGAFKYAVAMVANCDGRGVGDDRLRPFSLLNYSAFRWHALCV